MNSGRGKEEGGDQGDKSRQKKRGGKKNKQNIGILWIQHINAKEQEVN